MAENIEVLTLFVPGLLGPVAQADDPDFPWPDVSELHRALGKASGRLPIGGLSAESQLCSLFGMNVDGLVCPPLAQLNYLGDAGISPSVPCVCADPVRLHLDHNNALVQSGAPLQLNQHDAKEFCDSFNSVFAEDGVQLVFFDPHRWYLIGSIQELPDVPSLEEITGHHFNFAIPEGKVGREWRRWANNAQMILHDHAINLNRQEMGLPDVNSIWLSGGGDVIGRPTSRWSNAYSNSSQCKGLAHLAGLDCFSVPDTFQGIDSPAAQNLVHLQGPHKAILDGQLYEWSQSVEDVCRNWVEPAVKALRSGGLDCLELYVGNGPGYRVQRSGLRYFWKRPITIQSLQK